MTRVFLSQKMMLNVCSKKQIKTEENIPYRFIVNASSNKDGIVLDCFCGSGTTLVAAQELNRKWIGIDQSEQAIKTVKKKMENLPNDLFSNNDYEFSVGNKKSLIMENFRHLTSAL